MRAGNIVVLSDVVNGADEGWVRIYALLAIELDCVIPPRRLPVYQSDYQEQTRPRLGNLPEFVHNVYILLCDCISFIMLWLLSAP